MTEKLVTFSLTEAQAYTVVCACELEAQCLEDLGKDGNQAAVKWAVLLREALCILSMSGVPLIPENGAMRREAKP